jgi:pimeloyl-ACP methyl ester carboxylesterase
MGSILPSIHALALTDDEVSRAAAPVLTIHGRHDRSSPYGAGREWAQRLPNARLLTVDNAAHVPWIEAPALTLGAIDTFFDGNWPGAAERL